MTDEQNDATPPEPTAPPAFLAVPVADLPANTPKGANPETIALGTALLGIVNVTTAARDGLTFTDRKDAVSRAAILKRAVVAAGGAPAGHRIATPILANADGYSVVARLVAIVDKAKAKAK